MSVNAALEKKMKKLPGDHSIFVDITFKGPYVYEVNREKGVEICHVFADSIVFLRKIYCSFLPMEGAGGHKTGHFLWAS